MKKATILLPGVILTLAGLLVLLVPGKVITIITAGIAAFMLYQGIRNLYIVLKILADAGGMLRTSSIIKNVVNIIFSAVVLVMAFIRPQLIMSVLVYVIAIDLILSAGIDAFEVMTLHRMGSDDVSWFDVLWHVLLALLMFFFPRFFASAALTIVAVIMLVVGIVLIAASFFLWYRGRMVRKPEDDVIDVEWTESDK